VTTLPLLLELNLPHLSTRTTLALLPVVLLVLGVVAWALTDLVRAERVRYLPKPVWALLIVLFSVPFGALAYLVFGRSHHDPDLAGTHDATGPAGALGHGPGSRT
jgi:hypothetical protein